MTATVVYNHVAPFARRAIPKRCNYRTSIPASLDDRIAVMKDLRIHVAVTSACRLERTMDRTNANLVLGRQLLHCLAGCIPLRNLAPLAMIKSRLSTEHRAAQIGRAHV